VLERVPTVITYDDLEAWFFNTVHLTEPTPDGSFPRTQTFVTRYLTFGLSQADDHPARELHRLYYTMDSSGSGSLMCSNPFSETDDLYQVWQQHNWLTRQHVLDTVLSRPTNTNAAGAACELLLRSNRQ